MRVDVPLLLLMVGLGGAVWDCPFYEEDLPIYQQVAQEVIASLNSSSPKDVLSMGNVHMEPAENMSCARSSPTVRAGTSTSYNKYFHPRLWPNATVYWKILRDHYSQKAIDRMEKEIQWVDEHTCVTFVEVESCSVGEKCVVIMPPTEETVKQYIPIGCPPEDYDHVYYVTRLNDMTEDYGIMDWIMWVLGFVMEHSRYDRDKYLLISPANEAADLEWMKKFFLKGVQTIVHTVFPYDPQSASHMTIDMALYHDVNFTSKSPDYVIKETPDGTLSEIDIQKIHYYYCHATLTFPVSTLSPDPDPTTTTTSTTTTTTTSTPGDTEPPQTTTDDATTTTNPEPDTTETIPPTTTLTSDEATTMITTTTSTTTPDTRYTFNMKFDNLADALPDENFSNTASSTTMTTEATTTTAATQPTTTFPMISSGVSVSHHSIRRRMVEGALLVVVACWL